MQYFFLYMASLAPLNPAESLKKDCIKNEERIVENADFQIFHSHTLTVEFEFGILYSKFKINVFVFKFKVLLRIARKSAIFQ